MRGRPTDFVSEEGTANDLLMIFKRVPPAPKAVPPGKVEKPQVQAADSPASAPKDKDLKQEVEKLRTELAEFKMALKHAQSYAGSLKNLLKQKDEEIAGVLTRIDAEKSTVSITFQGVTIPINDLPLSSGVKILVKSKGETIHDLKVGMPVSMRVETNEGKSVISVIRERVQETNDDDPVKIFKKNQ